MPDDKKAITSIENPSYNDSDKACVGFYFEQDIDYISYRLYIIQFFMIKLKPSLVYSIDLFSQLSIFLEYMLKNNYIQFLSAYQKEHFKVILKTNLRSSSHAIRQLRLPNVASSSKMVLTNCGVAKSNFSMLVR